MITYEWGTSFGTDPEVVSLLREAADFDAEQGFSAVPPVPSAFGGDEAGRLSELIVRMSQEVGPAGAGEEEAVVAFLRVMTGSEGVGRVEFVVRPGFRSLGIATLLFERLGLADGGAADWAGDGTRSLRAWAHGSHPAAERMARRFGATPEAVLWRIIRPLRRANSMAEVAPPAGVRLRRLLPGRDEAAVEAIARTAGGAAWADLSSQEVLVAVDGPAEEVLGFVAFSARPLGGEGQSGLGSVHALAAGPAAAGHEVGRALLASALGRLADTGVREVEMSVDPLDEPLVRVCRALGFHHDQTDVCFRVPVGGRPAAG
ncbi:GNAT family N-acetyltransferase [Streptomyces sp. GD-15H]|uniref:GNAT family N-acetyltransferase n=1 Tax=Streptomyces sp. GD-15H TaxID=3129112 RepID=UPI003256309F